MPKQMMDEEGEMDSLYGDGETETKSPEGAETTDQEIEEEGADTAVAPVKVLQGKSKEPLKEGDEVVVKIVRVYGDEAEFEYSETPPSEIGGGGEYGDANAELDEMSASGSAY